MKKIFLLAVFFVLAPRTLLADPNVTLTSSHQESYVKVSSFTGCLSVAAACLVTTTLYPHRSFAAYTSTDTDLALVIVGPAGTLSSGSIAPIYLLAGVARSFDNGADQVVLPAGSRIFVYYVGSAPSTGFLVLDQLF